MIEPVRPAPADQPKPKRKLDPVNMSPAEQVSLLGPEEVRRRLTQLGFHKVKDLETSWRYYARPKQLAPAGDWSTWVLRAGRGFGKTRAGAGWIHESAMENPGRWMALIARTPADARDYMIEGPGGILRNAPPAEKPLYEVSKRRVTWPNGSWATIYSDEEPDQCRGFSGDRAWFDELGKYVHPRETWDNIAFGMREVSSDRPRRLITTTPRPLALLIEIEKMGKTVTVVGSSHENVGNVAEDWYEDLLRYEGTRIGRQEIDAEIITDLPGALWTRSVIENSRCTEKDVPLLVRIVVGVDPSGTTGSDKANQVGIVVVGLGANDVCYVMSDYTCSKSPAGWAKVVTDAFHHHKADRIVAEKNFGGAMVEHTIRTADDNVPIRMVNASRGKIARAEPVSALYEQKKIKLVGVFPEMEDQMCAFMPEPEGYTGEGSPDRVDAKVWAVHELVLQKFDRTEATETGLPRVMTGRG